MTGASCEGLNTTVMSIAVQEGYWRPSMESLDIRPCPYPSTCSNGTALDAQYNRNANATCTPGRGVSGIFCSLCQNNSNYFDPVTAQCRECELINALWYLLSGGLLVMLVRGLLTFSPHSWIAMRRRAMIAAKTVHVIKEIKLIISFYQIVTQIRTAYRITFPVAYVQLLSLFQIANGHAFSWIPGVSLHCIGFRTLESKVLAVTTVPLLLAVLPPFIGFVQGFRRGGDLANAASTAVLGLPVMLGFLFVVFPSCAAFGASVMAQCECFDTGGDLELGSKICFVREDGNIRCPTVTDRPDDPGYDAKFGQYQRVYSAARATVLLYALVVPLVFLGLLISNRRAIQVLHRCCTAVT